MRADYVKRFIQGTKHAAHTNCSPDMGNLNASIQVGAVSAHLQKRGDKGE